MACKGSFVSKRWVDIFQLLPFGVTWLDISTLLTGLQTGHRLEALGTFFFLCLFFLVKNNNSPGTALRSPKCHSTGNVYSTSEGYGVCVCTSDTGH